jgi:HK97 gp10 family phage protein
MILTAQVTGIDKLAARLAAAKAAAEAGLKTGVAKAAELFENEAKAVVPVLTGALRDAIHTGTVTDSQKVQTLAVAPAYEAANAYGFEPAYARRIEYGFIGTDSLGRNYHQAAQPYMRPAFDSQQEAAQEAIKDAITRQLDAAMAGGG